MVSWNAERRVIMTRLVVGFLLVVVRNILVDAVRELQILVYVARIRIIGVRTDGKVLLLLPFQDTFAPRRVIVTPLHLMTQGPGFLLRKAGVLLQVSEQLLFIHEMARDHRKHQPPIVPNILPAIEGIEQVCHHAVLA
jgi:hypothetical protein